MINANYCMNCMKEMPEDTQVCPHCSYNNQSAQPSPFLEKGKIIYNRYLVGKVQSFASDSVTYIGRDTETDDILTIVEFYPDKIVSRPAGTDDVSIKLGYEAVYRDYLKSFLSLWENIRELKGTICLPQVIDIIDSNCTVYAICKYKDCITLKHYFESKAPLPWKKARSAFKPIIQALSDLQEKGVCHGAISPESVCVGSDGKLHLTKFSIPECYKGAVELKSKPSYGFSALECYSQPPILNETVDVYSLTALIYYSITGIVPSEAMQRAVKDDMVMPSAVAKTLTKKEIEFFVKGLSLRANNRIQSASKLLDAIYYIDAPQANPATKQITSSAKAQPAVKKNNKAKSNSKANDDLKSMVPLMIKTFVTAVLVCTLLFISMYSTFLFKKVDIPAFNKLLSPISFLPVNKENASTTTPYSDETTTLSQQTTVKNERTYVTVPDFSEKTYESIKSNTVYNRNFTIVFEFEDSKKVPKNGVIKQSLNEGESVLSGSEITIVISTGYKQVELPDVIGMDFQAAKEKLEHKGFKVKKKLTENAGNQIPGEVYMMNKVAGLEFDEGTEIEISVWDEVKPQETTKKKTETTTKKAETTTKKATNE